MLRYNDYYNTKEIIRDQFVQLLYFQKNHKLRLLIFIFPYEYQLRTGVQENLFPQEMIAQATKDLGLNIIDLYNPIKKYLLDNDIKSQDLFIFNDPCHFSSEGHKIIADIILNEIKEEGIE
jgi:lysophospholipase L1-like esterase